MTTAAVRSTAPVTLTMLGVLAMGWQIRSGIPAEAMGGLLFRSDYVKDRSTRIIHPQQSIGAVQAWGSRPSRMSLDRAWCVGEISALGGVGARRSS